MGEYTTHVLTSGGTTPRLTMLALLGGGAPPGKAPRPQDRADPPGIDRLSLDSRAPPIPKPIGLRVIQHQTPGSCLAGVHVRIAMLPQWARDVVSGQWSWTQWLSAVASFIGFAAQFLCIRRRTVLNCLTVSEYVSESERSPIAWLGLLALGCAPCHSFGKNWGNCCPAAVHRRSCRCIDVLGGPSPSHL